MTSKPKKKLVALSANDRRLLKAARKSHASSRPHREVEGAVEDLRFLLDRQMMPGAVGPFLASNAPWILALLTVIEQVAAKGRKAYQESSAYLNYYPKLEREGLRQIHDELKARRTREAA